MTTRTFALHVHKFGGAALADGPAMRQAAAVLASQPPGPAVIVVSAMRGVTDGLLALAEAAGAGRMTAVADEIARLRGAHRSAARVVASATGRAALRHEVDAAIEELALIARGLAALRELTPRTRDDIIARGERLAAWLFTAAAMSAGIDAVYVDAVEVIRTDERFGAAQPDLAATTAAARERLLPLLRRGRVPVVPGFLGVAPTGHVTTLGRGGSDLTATLLARALGARHVSLWKDVPGILTADPRAVPDARVVPQLHPREAVELACAGATVLHPRTLAPVARQRVRLHVRPFADPAAPGTEISGRRTLACYPVKAISATPAHALLTLTGTGMLGGSSIPARTLGALGRAGITASLVTQGSSEHSLCVGVPAARAAEAECALRRELAAECNSGEVEGITMRGALATLAVVGLGMAGSPGIAARLFTALSLAHVNVVAIAQGSTELNISVVIDAAQVTAALRAVHAAFQLSKIGGGGVSHAGQSDVVVLGFGQIGRALAPMMQRPRPRGPRLRTVAIIDRSGFLFDPRGLSARRMLAAAAAKLQGIPLARLPGGRTATAAEALDAISGHALERPILVDATAGETTSLLLAALETGMDVVLANKRPLTGPRAAADAIAAAARAAGRRVLHEATVGAGLPIIDTFRKLADSGDRVLGIEGCPSGTLGFLFGEMGRGQSFSFALRGAIVAGYTEPDPREDLSGADVARKALILGRLLGFPGEFADVAVESLVPPAARAWPLDEYLARLEEEDAEWARRVGEARERGGVLRYRAIASRRAVRVGMQVVDLASPSGALTGTDNQFIFTTTRYRTNPLVITGPGAGPAVTAAGILTDVLTLAGG